ncbi:ESPR-type extended signal peptide-containing protein [Testudinibacter sp. P80/BLE/0925]|uniref:ESPR-type extended signal peptide-containing protein n=1 Tax=Testudinibacter sp. TW-1 TaxID=3417757 RepID=UPI003D36199D
MNKIYRVIWNKNTQQMVVVSELTTTQGKSTSESTGSANQSATNRRGLFSHFIFNLKVSVIAITTALFGTNALAYQENGSGASDNDNNVVIGGGTDVNQASKVTGGGDNSTIIGAGAKGVAADNGRAEGATAIGAGAQASGGATALGWNAKVSNTTGGVAIGSDTSVSGANAVAMGWAAQSYAAAAIAIGTQAIADSAVSPTINQGANISIGAHAYSSNFGPVQLIADRTNGNSVAFRDTDEAGTMITGMKPSAVSIGEHSKAYAGSTAVGYNNLAGVAGEEGTMAFAFGNNNDVTGFYATALGLANTSTGTSAVALGTVNNASGNTAIAIGRQVTASGNYSTALGNVATASGNNAFAVGHSSQASGNRAIAIGSSTATTSNLATGTATRATSADAIAVGTNSRATGDDAIAIGQGTRSAQKNTTAIGRDAQSLSPNSIAIGTDAKAQGANTSVTSMTAIGHKASATGHQSIALGTDASASGSFSAALGLLANAVGTESIALSGDATATQAVALGSRSSATVEGGVALGSSSVANRAAGSAGYDPLTSAASTATNATWRATTAAVSIGGNGQTRQITNLAAGSADTDAVNVAQLKKLADKPLTFSGDSGTDIQRTLGQTLEVNGGATGSLTDNNIGVVSNINNNSLNIKLAEKINLGVKGSVQTGNTLMNDNGVTITNGPSMIVAGINAGNKTITNLAEGKADTDAVNVSQLKKVAQQAAKTVNVVDGKNTSVRSNTVGDVTTYQVDAEKVLVSVKADSGLLLETNTNENDKITGYELSLTEEAQRSLEKADAALSSWTAQVNGETAKTIDKDKNSVNFVNGDNIVISNENGDIKVSTAKDVTFDSLTAGGNVAINKDGIDAGNKAITNVASGGNDVNNAANIGDVQSAVAAAKTHFYSVNSTDKTAGNYDNKGATGTDALAAGVAASATGNYATAVGAGAQATNDSSTAVGNNAKAQHRNTLALGNTSTASGANSVAAGYASGATATNSVAVGSSAKAAGAASIALGNSASATGTNAIAMGSNSTTGGTSAIAIGEASNAAIRGVAIGEKASSNASSVAIGENAKAAVTAGDVAIGQNSTTIAATQVSSATVNGINYSGFAGNAPKNAFSVGSVGAERQIQNVAAGRITATSTDAINGSQLYAVAEVAGKGWNIQANSGTSSKVAPGDTVNFVNGSGTTAAVNTANGTSTVSYAVNKSGFTVADNGDVSAQNAGDNFATATDVANAINSANKTTVVQAGNNVTVNDPVVNGTVTTYTVNADGTSVSAGSAVQVTKGEKDSTTNMTDYAVDLTDATKADIKKGVEAATDIADKGLTFTGDNNSKTDVKKLGETVAVTGDENITSTASATGIALALSKNLTVDSVKTGNTTVNNDGITIANGTNPVSLTNTGLNNGGNTITNVAEGVNDTDAVNKSQLDTVETKADNNTTDIANLQNQTWKLQANSDEASAVKANDTVQFINGENIDISRDGNNITIATAKEVSFDKATVGTGANQVVLDDKGVNVGGKTYISKDGINANSQVISNVASGGDVTGNAANIGDVQKAAAAAKSEVKAGTNVASVTSETGADKQTVYTVNADGASVSAAEGSAVSVTKAEKNSSTNITDYALDLTQTTKDNIKKGVDAKEAVDSKGLTFTGDSGSTDEKLLGSQVAVNGDNNITTTASADGVKIALNKALNVDSVTAGNTTLNNDGVTITGGTNNVSLTNTGLNNGGNQITNVASGGDVTGNAANIGDVQKAAAAAKSEVKAGTNVASVEESKGDNNQTVYTVNANGAKTSAGSSAVTVTSATPDTNNVTDYKVDLSDASKESLTKADSALQSWTAQVNGAEAKVVNKDNANVNFVNGGNIEITAEADGDIKVSTAKEVSFDSVTLNKGGNVAEGSKSAVNGGDVYRAIQNSESQFQGDNDTVIKRKPTEVLRITGGATGDTTANNIKTVGNADGSIAIQLAKNLTGLSSIATETIKVGDKVEINKDGINAGGTTISNVASGGTNANNAANIGDVQKAAAAAKTEVSQGTNVASVVKTEGTDGQSVYTVNADGASVSATEESAVKVTKGAKDNTTNVTDYALDLTDETKAEIKKGAEAANDIANKGLTFTADNNTTTGVKKLGETVAITGDDNITTTASVTGIALALNPNLNVTSVTTGNTTMSTDGVTINAPTADNPTNTVSLTNSGLNNGGNKITNIADGTEANDAVNKSQLDELAKNIAAGEKSAVVKQGNNTTVTSTVDGNVTTYTVNAEKSTVSAADSGGLVATPTEDKANNVTDYAISLSQATKDSLTKADGALQSWTAKVNGNDVKTVDQKDNSVNFVNGDNIVVSNENGDIKVSTAKDLTVDSVTSGDTKVNSDGITIANGENPVSLTSSGLNNGNNKITNVADGAVAADSKEAVNGGQLFATNQNVTTNANNITNLQNQTWKLQANGDEASAVKASDTVRFVDGDNINITRDGNNITVATVAAPTFSDVKATSVTAGNTALNNDGVTINGGANNPVSLTNNGLNNGGNTITHVANGENPTDAVNKQQLDAVETAAGNKLGDFTVGADAQAKADGIVINNDSKRFDVVGHNGVETAVSDKQITVGLNAETQASLKNADSALQSWTAQVNGTAVKTVDQKNNSVNFVNGDNIVVSNENGNIKVSTAKEVAFDSVTINHGGSVTEGSKSAVNGGDVYNAIQNNTAQFKGDNDTIITRKPAEVLSITGGATDETTANNIKTIGSADGSIAIQLAKNLTDLANIATEALKVGDKVAIDKNGINAGGTTISNVADAVNGKDAVNKDQLDALAKNIADNEKSAVVEAGKNVTVDNSTSADGKVTTYTVNAEKTTVSEGNGITVTAGEKDDNGVTDYKIALDKDITIGNDDEAGALAIKGADGKDGISLNGADGTIGLNGKDGATATIGVKDGKPGLNGADGTTQPRLTVGGNEIATLNDGLKFKGDVGEVIPKALNQTLTIKGNVAEEAEVTDKNIRVDNENGDLVLKMARNLQNLSSATFVDNDGFSNVINAKGMTIASANPNKAPVSLTENGLDNGGNRIQNVANAVNDSDAVNLGQLTDAIIDSVAYGRVVVKAGENTNVKTEGERLNGGATYTVNADKSVVTAENGGSITVTPTEVTNADGVKTTTFAVKLNDDISVNSVTAGDNVKLDTTGLTVGDVKISTDGINAGDKQITNVANGNVAKDSKDAVNGGQLFNQAEGVKNLIGGATTYDAATGTYTNNNIGGTGQNTIDAAIKAANDQANAAAEQAGKGWNLSVNNGVNAGNIAPAATVDLNNSDKNIVISKADNNVTFDLAKELTLDSVSINKPSEVSAGSNNVATTGQLHNTANAVATALGGGSTVDANGNVTAPTYTITKTDGSTVTANSVGGALNYFNREVVKPITFAGDEGSYEAKLGNTVNVKGGNNIKTAVSGNTLTISMTDTPEFTSITTGNTTMSTAGIRVKGGANGDVSLTANGLNNGGNRITNIADGVENNDAATVGQVKSMGNALNGRINEVDGRARAGIAGALATAGLYQAYLPGHSMVAVGAGTFRGENALAIGVSRVSDNGKIGVKLSGMSTSQGDVGGSVSVGYQW